MGGHYIARKSDILYYTNDLTIVETRRGVGMTVFPWVEKVTGTSFLVLVDFHGVCHDPGDVVSSHTWRSPAMLHRDTTVKPDAPATAPITPNNTRKILTESTIDSSSPSSGPCPRVSSALPKFVMNSGNMLVRLGGY